MPYEPYDPDWPDGPRRRIPASASANFNRRKATKRVAEVPSYSAQSRPARKSVASNLRIEHSTPRGYVSSPRHPSRHAGSSQGPRVSFSSGNRPLLFSVSRPPPRVDRSATKSAHSRHHIPSASASSSVSQHGLDPLDKIAATKSPMTRTMAEVYLEHAQEAELRRKREERGLSFGRARMVASMSASASGPNLSTARRGISAIASQSQRDELPKYYIGPGAKLMSTDDEQSESGSDEEHHAHPRRPVIDNGKIKGKFARKQYPHKMLHGTARASKSARRPSAATLVDDSSDASDTSSCSSNTSIDLDAAPPEVLLKALSGLPVALSTHTMLCVQRTAKGKPPVRFIPFQRRVLKTCFERRCEERGISIAPDAAGAFPARGVGVLWRVQGEEDLEFMDQRSMTSLEIRWTCPLCILHGRFPNREVLRAHLEWDHDEVKSIWVRRGRGKTFRWELVLELPNPDVPSDSSSSDSEEVDELEDDITVPRPRSQSPTRASASRGPSPSIPLSTSTPFSPSTSVSLGRQSTPPEELPISHHHSSPSPSPSPPLIDSLNLSDTESDSEDREQHRVPFGPATPLPLTVPSARPGGPRLYDLLPHPADPDFHSKDGTDDAGIMTWEIIDREEEMFELDDVRDEDKVMQALWARWIMFNRNKFVSNYVKGTQAFIDRYWKLIYDAAGWGALRAWLLMFVVNRFLTGSQSVQMLTHYEKLVEEYLDEQEGNRAARASIEY